MATGAEGPVTTSIGVLVTLKKIAAVIAFELAKKPLNKGEFSGLLLNARLFRRHAL